MKRLTTIFSSLFLAFILSACSYSPFLYKTDIQQGNIYTSEQAAQIQLGMNRELVHQILGTPAVNDPFHANIDNYIFTFKSGSTNRLYRRSLTIQYTNGVVTSVRENPLIIENK
ncbi:outer membrane protein assembly factor BamE [Suttonella ornithocola]|uniref:Outer membrane protein assembly factor BamE n=1 Tax=Suttonella ornithocola TaxID=279832 RepID=A0A380MY33_9GAMM|nr:outer membrane protein assembly factor BamE [Suttonella ornithocola]SUO97202.1 Small protein A precursor [Suttonella ornithocola]